MSEKEIIEGERIAHEVFRLYGRLSFCQRFKPYDVTVEMIQRADRISKIRSEKREAICLAAKEGCENVG